MKRFRVLAGTAVGLLILASLAGSYLQPAPLAVAMTYCSDQGIQPAGLSLLGFQGSSGLLGNKETVEFLVQSSTPRKKLIVELRQSLYFLRWKVVAVHEESQP